MPSKPRASTATASASLAGEGIRISADTPALQEWIEGWLRTQGMSGRMLTDLVGDSEVVGQVLWTMDEQGELTAWPSFIGAAREPAWWPVYEGPEADRHQPARRRRQLRAVAPGGP